MRKSPLIRHLSSAGRLPLLAVSLLLSLALTAPGQQRIPTRAHALDAAPSPNAELAGSTPLTLTLRLRPTDAQQQALDALLAAQLQPGSPGYHVWLTASAFADRFSPTPDQIAALAQWLTASAFAEKFSPSPDQIAALAQWLTAQGFTVTSTSPARTSLTVTGSAQAAETAFTIQLGRVRVGSADLFANTADPTLPAAFAPFIRTIDGLDTLPSAATRIQLGSGSSLTAKARLATSSPEASVPAASTLADLASLVDANQNPILTLSSSACTADLAPSDIATFRDVLRQAAAQGITVLTDGACSTPAGSAFPSALADVTAAISSPVETAAATSSPDPRPTWQAAPGLPANALRLAPDFAVTSTADLASTVSTLIQQTGNRVGNLSPTLYSLAATPGLFSHATAAATPEATSTTTPATWSATDGLGTLSLSRLLQVYPRGLNGTQVSLISSSYAINYGDSFTLTAKVLPYSYATTNPTGTVTFVATGQGTIGSASIDSSGTATFTPDTLPVGTYSLVANYSGDGNYAGGSSTSRVTITVSIVNARLTATISPQTNIPFGSTATATATVALPGANAAPSGPVTAQVQGVTGATASATLSPNPGGNTATANIVVSAPAPGNYTIQVTCQGNTNYQCQTPVNLPISSVKGYVNLALAVTPAAPQAGQPITLTATVSNAGNGTGTYTFNGSVTFYDSGKILATAPVATSQATTTLALSGNRTHNITATYTGDSNWNSGTSAAVAVTPTILPDAVTLSSNVSGPSSLAGVNIIFTATSTTTITYGTGPTGSITFFDTFNGAVVQLGNPSTMVSNGPVASIAVLTTTGLLAGQHHIYAVYSGDNNYAPATSATLNLTIGDFSLTMTPPSLTLSQGKSQQVAVIVGTSGGFTGPVTLGCTPPASSLASCSFAPASLTGGGVTTLTVTTVANTSAARPSGSLWPAAVGASLAGLVCLMLPGRRRLPSLFAVLFAVALSANLGCGLGVIAGNNGNSGTGGSSGSSSGGSSSANGTPLGTQNFLITAAGSDGTNTARHTYQYQVTVQ